MTSIDLSEHNLRGVCCISSTRGSPFEKRNARAGPPLPETLLLLAPLAPTLEKLNLGGNKLGGTITDGIVTFSKITELDLRGMGLEGACLC